MVSHLVFYQLALIAVVWVFLMLSELWPSEPTAAHPQTPKPLRPPRTRSKEPKPFLGLTYKPSCEACTQGVASRREPPCASTSRAPLESSRHGGAAPLLCGDSCTRSGAAGQGWRQPGEAFPWASGQSSTGNGRVTIPELRLRSVIHGLHREKIPLPSDGVGTFQPVDIAERILR